MNIRCTEYMYKTASVCMCKRTICDIFTCMKYVINLSSLINY